MSQFIYNFEDFKKITRAVDITNGADTITIHSTKHVVESCVCSNCKSIMAQRKAAEDAKKKEQWTYKYTYTPPAPAPVPVHSHAHSCCRCCHHHHH
ncbi:hypothetical protein H4R20_005697 [Coemansia guatemalensis]|uniref:Uncharacterized protein n=1 Tax=Coemansia guatemalensis TaxID=2761395 RepID=A0A9W8HXD5_9FUNG|nr:hypothetical protein H4R20_005697 [Coemansia guatemalensis]